MPLFRHRAPGYRMLLILVALACAPPMARAQQRDLTDLDPEELMQLRVDTVKGAARYLQKISDAPASITIVTAQQIRGFGYRSLTDVLAGVPGFYVTDDRNYSYFGTRGLIVPGDYNSRMLVLVDGHRINDNIYDSVLAGTEFPVDIDLIDRLEVIRGPGGAMYGANAFSAVINIVTVRGSQLNGLNVALEAGTLGSGRGRGTFGKRFSNGSELVLSGSEFSSAGDATVYFPAFDSPSTNHGVAAHADADRARRFLGSFSTGDFTVHAAYGGRRKQVPTASFGTVFNDGREETFDSRGYAELQYAREVGLTDDVLARVYYDAVRYEGHYPLADDGAGVLVSTDTATGDAVGSELTFSRRFGARHRLVMGSEYRFNFRQNLATYDLFQQYLDARHPSTVWALNLQDEVRLHHYAIATGALRYDHQTLFSGRVTPRGSLVVGPFRRTHVKLLYGEAFRAPSANDLYYNTPLAQIGNVGLKPESVRSLELVAEHRPSESLAVSVSVNRTVLEDIIVPSAGSTYGNDRADVGGIEIGGRYTRPNGTDVALSYAHEYPRDEATKRRLYAAPRGLAKLQVMTPLFVRQLRGGLEILQTSSVLTHTGEQVPSSWITNLTLSNWRFSRQADLSGIISNLFDSAASYPVSDEHVQGSVPQYGRRLTVRLTCQF